MVAVDIVTTRRFKTDAIVSIGIYTVPREVIPFGEFEIETIPTV